MLSWTIGQKVPKPKCFQKCFISLCCHPLGCCHCPVQMSTPSPARPAFQLFTRTQACQPLLRFGNFCFGITKKGQLHHSSDSTHLWQPFSGLRNELGWLAVWLFALGCALRIAKTFSGAAEKTKETLRLTFSISSLWPSPKNPHFFWVSAQGRVNKWKTLLRVFTNFPP